MSGQCINPPKALAELASFHRKPRQCGAQSLKRQLPHYREATTLSILKRYAPSLIYDSSIHWEVRSTVEKMMDCRSGAFGSNHYQCNACGSHRPLYNKCSDRHCVNCGRIARRNWTQKVTDWDLPTTFFHTTFTTPHQLNDLFYINQRECYNLFFRCVHKTLLERIECEFHCKPGIITALHTWGQRLFYHIHIHATVTAGGESIPKKSSRKKDNNLIEPTHWIGIDWDAPAMEAHSLAQEFSGNFVAGLKELYYQDKLEIPRDAEMDYVDDQETFDYWVDQLLNIDWQATSKC